MLCGVGCELQYGVWCCNVIRYSWLNEFCSSWNRSLLIPGFDQCCHRPRSSKLRHRRDGNIVKGWVILRASVGSEHFQKLPPKTLSWLMHKTTSSARPTAWFYSILSQPIKMFAAHVSLDRVQLPGPTTWRCVSDFGPNCKVWGVVMNYSWLNEFLSSWNLSLLIPRALGTLSKAEIIETSSPTWWEYCEGLRDLAGLSGFGTFSMIGAKNSLLADALDQGFGVYGGVGGVGWNPSIWSTGGEKEGSTLMASMF